MMAKINVLNKEVAVDVQNEEDYICITDIARYKDSERTDYLIQNWLRTHLAAKLYTTHIRYPFKFQNYFQIHDVKLISQTLCRDYIEQRQCSVYLDTISESGFLCDSRSKFENKQIL